LAGEKNDLAAERIASILNVNSHGSRNSLDKYSKNKQSELYPALSMFNHSSTLTCGFVQHGGCSVVVMKFNVNAGDELTMSYGHDEETVRCEWNIAVWTQTKFI
jgi:hypothetical protein